MMTEDMTLKQLYSRATDYTMVLVIERDKERKSKILTDSAIKYEVSESSEVSQSESEQPIMVDMRNVNYLEDEKLW